MPSQAGTALWEEMMELDCIMQGREQLVATLIEKYEAPKEVAGDQ